MSRFFPMVLTAGLLLCVGCDPEDPPATEPVESAEAERAPEPNARAACATSVVSARGPSRPSVWRTAAKRRPAGWRPAPSPAPVFRSNVGRRPRQIHWRAAPESVG